jgi:hypothetical protein
LDWGPFSFEIGLTIAISLEDGELWLVPATPTQNGYKIGSTGLALNGTFSIMFSFIFATIITKSHFFDCLSYLLGGPEFSFEIETGLAGASTSVYPYFSSPFNFSYLEQFFLKLKFPI